MPDRIRSIMLDLSGPVLLGKVQWTRAEKITPDYDLPNLSSNLSSDPFLKEFDILTHFDRVDILTFPYFNDSIF